MLLQFWELWYTGLKPKFVNSYNVLLLPLKIYIILKKGLQNICRIRHVYDKKINVLSWLIVWKHFLLHFSNYNRTISSLSCNSRVNTKFHKLVLILSLQTYYCSKLFKDWYCMTLCKICRFLRILHCFICATNVTTKWEMIEKFTFSNRHSICSMKLWCWKQLGAVSDFGATGIPLCTASRKLAWYSAWSSSLQINAVW